MTVMMGNSKKSMTPNPLKFNILWSYLLIINKKTNE